MSGLDPYAVFTLEDLKKFLTIPMREGADDAALTIFGNGVSNYVEERTNTRWKARDYTFTLDGDGRSSLLRLPRPINSVASLVVNGTALVQGTDFVVYSDLGKITRLTGVFCKGLQNVVLTLNAGYQTVPYDVVQAALELAKSAYDELKTGGISLSSISIGSAHTILRPGINPRIEKFLDAKRDVRV